MEKFTKVKNIGKGNMGACALARNNEDGRYYVIKQVDLAKLNKKERQQSLNEAKVLSSLRHPNVINYFDSFLARKSDHLCIVMEFADGGDLSNRIKNNHGINFTETQILDWLIQIVLSLHYIHQRKILHRDVKTQNIFLTQENLCKLGDFGIARTLNSTYDQASTFVGTPYYLSPELILERPYDHMSDVWALGVVLYELLALRHPFNANDMKSLMHRILKVQYEPPPTMYSSELRSIVARILVKDPMQRIRLGEILELPIVVKRIRQWIDGGVLPSRYVTTLLRAKLLPPQLLAYAMQSIPSGGLSAANVNPIQQQQQQQSTQEPPRHGMIGGGDRGGGYGDGGGRGGLHGGEDAVVPPSYHPQQVPQQMQHSRSPEKMLPPAYPASISPISMNPAAAAAPPPLRAAPPIQQQQQQQSGLRKDDDVGVAMRYQPQMIAPSQLPQPQNYSRQPVDLPDPYRRPQPLPPVAQEHHPDYQVYRSAALAAVQQPQRADRGDYPAPQNIYHRNSGGLPQLSSAVGMNNNANSGVYRAYQAQQDFVAPRSLAPVVVHHPPQPLNTGLPPAPLRPSNAGPNFGGGGVAAAIHGHRGYMPQAQQIQQHNNDIQAMLQRAAYERAQRQKLMR